MSWEQAQIITGPWLHERGLRGRAYMDGEDVTDDCLDVTLLHERPIAFRMVRLPARWSEELQDVDHYHVLREDHGLRFEARPIDHLR